MFAFKKIQNAIQTMSNNLPQHFASHQNHKLIMGTSLHWIIAPPLKDGRLENNSWAHYGRKETNKVTQLFVLFHGPEQGCLFINTLNQTVVKLANIIRSFSYLLSGSLSDEIYIKPRGSLNLLWVTLANNLEYLSKMTSPISSLNAINMITLSSVQQFIF